MLYCLQFLGHHAKFLRLHLADFSTFLRKLLPSSCLCCIPIIPLWHPQASEPTACPASFRDNWLRLSDHKLCDSGSRCDVVRLCLFYGWISIMLFYHMHSYFLGLISVAIHCCDIPNRSYLDNFIPSKNNFQFLKFYCRFSLLLNLYLALKKVLSTFFFFVFLF